MRIVRTLILYLIVFLPLKKAVAQTEDSTSRQSTMAYVDSVVNNDSLMRDLSAFIDSSERPKTLLAVQMGFGNGFFTTKNATAATGYASKNFLTPSITYLHKSGLGISASAYALSDEGKFTVYQGAITPSFDISRRNWAAGISYTRYINKDSVSFGLNPLRNDVYVYGTFKKFWLEPGAAFDYSFDYYKLELFLDEGGYPPFTAPIEKDLNIHAQTTSTIFTLQHDFEWFQLVSKNDHIAFTPTLMALADASNYNIDVINRLKSGKKTRWPTNITGGESSTGFAFESYGALLDAIYTYKHFLLDPQLLAEYFVDASPGVQALRISFLVNIGLVF